MQWQLLQGEETVRSSLLPATAGRSCKGHCNTLVPAGAVYFLFISEAENSHQAVGTYNLETRRVVISTKS